MAEIILFTGAVYGLSWAVTRAKIGAPFRRWAAGWRFLDTLSVCIVCMSAWVGLGLGLLAGRSALLAPLEVRTWVDALALVGWSMAATWAVGRALGDAE